MKKNKLYTANRWNKNLFAIGGYSGGGLGLLDQSTSQLMTGPTQLNSSALNTANLQANNNALTTKLTDKAGGISSGGFNADMLSGVTTAAGSMVGNALSGGLSSGVGNAVSGLADIASAIPVYGKFAGPALKIAAGGINALIGTSVNEAALKAAKEGTNQLNSLTFNKGSFDAASQGHASVANVEDDIYKGGLLVDVSDKNEELKRQRREAELFAQRGEKMNILNLQQDQTNNLLRNSFAFGGPTETEDMGAVNYGFMSDYLTQKKRENDMKGKMSGIVPMPAFMPNSYAIGGDLQTNGADFSDGLVAIGAGGSHEENKYEGVQLGVDNENVPNLVEEGETVYENYVFSNRILADEATKQMFRLPKKKDITFADISKRLEKEIAERPNDPVSKAGFEKQMQMLEEQQERQKQEMEAERAKAAFEALSPEEQTALMQQRAEQEAMAQQAAMQEAVAQQQLTPEELAIAQQQQQMADGSEAALGQEPEMNNFGGKINRFDKGGVLKLLNSLGYKTVAEAEKAGWKPSDFGDYRAWTDIDSNSKLSDNFVWTDEFSKRLTTPEQKAALSLGWTPTAALLGRKWYEGDNGNSVGWTQSVGKNALNAKEFNDYAKRYKNTLGWAVDNGIIKAPEGNATVSMADIAKAMREAPDWKATDNWLYSDIANQASYLGMARGLNPDDDTKFTDRWSPYGSFSKDADGNWSYTLKSDLTDTQKKAFTDQFRRARTDNQIGVMYNNFQDPTSVTNRYVLDEEGNPVLLTTDDLTGYEQLGSYTWGNPDANKNNTAILYKSKNPAAAKSAEEPLAEEQPERKIVPDLRKETSFGLLGPAVGLGLMGLGIGKPDVASYDAAVSGAGNYATADWMPRGDFLTYRPIDPWRWTNPILANSRATDRAIVNTSGGNRGTAMAGLLANGYNTTIGLGEAGLKGEDTNFDRRLKIATHNADVYKSNQGEYGVTSRFNASAYNDASRASAQMKLHAAQAKDDANRWWASNLYGNINGLFDNINQWEKWKRDYNSVAKMAANGVFGVGTEDTPIFGDYVKEDKKDKRSASNGGKLKKKRGLTI